MKTREQIEKEFESIIEIMEKEAEFDSYISKTSIGNLLKKIHQIRQDDLEEVKKIIKEKGLHLGYKNDILDKLDNLNK